MKIMDNDREPEAAKMTKRAPSPVKETGGLKDLLRWPVRPFARTWLTSPTVAVLALGLGLTFAGFSGAAWNMWLDMWLTGAGLALVGFVIVKEGLLWRWMDRRSRVEERDRASRELAQALADERSRADRELKKAVAAEREHAAKALADERAHAGQELTKTLAQALSEERARADRELKKAVAAEREHAAKALADERAHAGQELTKTLAQALSEERARADRELKKAVAAEREHAAKALADERAHAGQELTKTLAQALSEERARADRELKKAVAAEREHAAKALADERAHAGQELTKTLAQALSEERARADRELKKAVAAEREHAAKALADERRRAGQELTKALEQALAAERDRTDKALAEERARATEALADERARAGQALSKAVGKVDITVGVACYNAAPYLERCIGSLLEQTFDNFEIVAVNDGSTDRTASILDELARTSGKVRVFHQEDNKGQGLARNLILEQAGGEYITFVDADDWLAPHCLEAVYRRALRDDLDILCFGWVLVDESAARVVEKRHDHLKLRFDRPGELRQHAFAGRLNLLTGASLARAALFHDHGLRYPEGPHDDMYVTPFLHFYAERHGYLDGELYFWSEKPDSASRRSLGEDHIDSMFRAFHEWKTRLSREGRFDDFRASFVAGVIAYMFQLLRRIEASDVDREGRTAYLTHEARAFPELRKYKQYLTPNKIRYYAKAIEIIDDSHDAAAETGNGRDTTPAALPHRSVPVRKKRRARRSA